MKDLFNLRDINYWLLASGFALDAIFTLMLFVTLLQFLQGRVSTIATVQMIMMGGIFIGNFATAWLVGKMANDLRGPTYGIISSLASAAVSLLVLIPTGGTFGFLVAVAAVAGGFNGGMVTLPRRPQR